MKRIKDLLPGSGAGISEESFADETEDTASEVEDEKKMDRKKEKAEKDDLYDLEALFEQIGAPSRERPEEAPGPDKMGPLPDAPTPRREVPDIAASHRKAPSQPRPEPPPQQSPRQAAARPALNGEVDSIQDRVSRLEISVTDLGSGMKRMEGRQQTTEKNIQDLLKIYELMSRQFKSFTAAGGLPEHGLKTGTGEVRYGANDAPSRGEQLTDEHETGFAETWRQPPSPTAGYNGGPPGPGMNGNGNGRISQRPLLDHLRNDYTTVVLVMRWIEFLLERVKRDKISALLEYYKDIGWISHEVKKTVMAYARGEVQDVTAYEPELDDSLMPFSLEDDENPVMDDRGTPAHPHYRPLDDWKLTAEDHLKSMLFIKKMAGCRINKDELNAIEQDIGVLKYSLRRYHEI